MHTRHTTRTLPREVPAGSTPAQQSVRLFDLDNTLRHASHVIFLQIDQLMTAYMTRVLGMDDVTANQVRIDYRRRYGATILNMAYHHGVDLDDFLVEAHRFDDLRAMVRTERGLAQLLHALPGHKILLTNAPVTYTCKVSHLIGLRHTLLHEIAIEHMQVHRHLRLKPGPLTLRLLSARKRTAPSHAILVEDALSHLRHHRRLGIGTVWVASYLRRVPPGVQPTSVTDALHPMQTVAMGVHTNSPHQPVATLVLFANQPGYVSTKIRSVLQLRRRPARRGQVVVTPCSQRKRGQEVVSNAQAEFPTAEPVTDVAIATSSVCEHPYPGERCVQILRTLADVFEHPRGEKITTAGLAARLDVSEATLYRHFANEVQMFEELIESIEQTVLDLINQITLREEYGLRQAHAIAHILLPFVDKSPDMTRVLMGDALVDEDKHLSERMAQCLDRIEASLRQNLRMVATQGTWLTDADVASRANLFVCAVLGR